MERSIFATEIKIFNGCRDFFQYVTGQNWIGNMPIVNKQVIF